MLGDVRPSNTMGHVRHIDGENLFSAVRRLMRFNGPIAFCWTAIIDEEEPQLLTVTARGGREVPTRHYQYDRLLLHTQTYSPGDLALRIVAGRITAVPGFPEVLVANPPGYPLLRLHTTLGTANWVTTGVDTMLLAAIPAPSYYFWTPLANNPDPLRAHLDQPLFGRPPLPHYPRASDAVFELMYGVTRDQGRMEVVPSFTIQLPHDGAHLRSLAYVENHGMVALIGEGITGGAAGHSLQAAWKLHHSDRELTRSEQSISTAGPISIPVGAEPAFFSAAVLDSGGQLVDSAQTYAEPDEDQVPTVPLPSEAILDALDHLNSEWRNAFNTRLFAVRRMAPVGQLALPVTTRSDFEGRLSALNDVLKGVAIPDSLLATPDVGKLPADASLGRIRSVLKRHLAGPDLTSADHAVGVLQDVIRLRVALQHAHANPDLPTALAKLNLPFPLPWHIGWEAARYRIVGALGEIRKAVSTLT